MLDARVYRTTLVPVLVALIVCAFSLEDRDRPIRTTLAPDAFAALRAERDLAALAAAFPARRPGSAADTAMAGRIAATLRAISPAYQVSSATFDGETIDGMRRLTTVIARQEGAPGPGLVVVAHRDAAGRGARAELSGTAAMLEMARVLRDGQLRRTVTFASTSGGSGGAAGARDLARRLARPVDAVLVLGDLAGARARRPFVVGWSQDGAVAPLQLRRTVEEAVRAEADTPPGEPRAPTQWVRMAFAGTVGEQGPLVAAGLPAVTLSVAGELPPRADEPLAPGRLEAFGRAALRAVFALDAAPDIDRAPRRDLVIATNVLPGWAVRILVAALLLPALLTTVDGFARARRRRWPAGSGLALVALAAAPPAVGALLMLAAGLTGLLPATPPGPTPVGAIPFAWPATIVVPAVAVLAPALGLLGARAALGRAGARARVDGPGAAVAVLLAWCALALVLWILDPYAAALMVPAAHLWLLLAEPRVRLGRAAALGVFAASLVPFALAAAVLGRQLGAGPLDLAWQVLLVVAGGHVGPAACLYWSGVAGCIVAAAALAWRSPAEPQPAPPLAVGGPAIHARTGTPGRRESALPR